MEPIALPSIKSLYDDRTIFITGASGFLGKVLIEKMLYSLPGIRRIYILIRASRGKSGAERWRAFENLVLFNRVRRDCPDRLEKIVAVEGDITLPDLGMAEADVTRILDETSMVFHCAATVRFDEPLKRAVELNMKGVSRVISICYRMPKLECFLHCSSCYANADKPGILVEEKIYQPPPCDPHKLLETEDVLDDSEFDRIEQEAVMAFGNTYCFTKCLAEHLVMEEAASLPALIFRPSIIGAVLRDGIPGWADKLQGLGAMITAFGTGAMSRIPVDLEARVDAVPVDVVSAAMTVCGAYRLASKERWSIPIVHCGTSSLNPIIYKECRSAALECAYKYPLARILSTPMFSNHGSDSLERWMHQMRARFLGPLLDALLTLAGQKPFFTRLYGRLGGAYSIFKKFISDYTFESENIVQILGMMTAEDKEIFQIDVRKIDIIEFGCTTWMGVKVFFMKDDIDNMSIRRARKNLKLIQLKDFVLTVIVCSLCTLLLTGSTTSWHVLIPLVIIAHFYFNVQPFKAQGILSIRDYQSRIENAMGATLKSMKDEKRI
ncbi:hypothetical protein PMAYCL1PPCAC_15055 [Pristionchus mayeri]|uniref:Fatty acyl-CoA reductase n=1 Tax=Pristionchus mayeri TaxID=1317129 RepID=A0AAN5CIA3_9BILA|nr:hypothetical protein PMAYCL1PPCAC_15055 [Pristionchus mayeri]